jgi:formylglycine-generating enzyme required for sulfatase activity
MQRRITYFLTISLLFFGANFLVSRIASQTNPFSLRQMLNAVASVKEGRIPQSKIISDIRKRKVDFQLTKENEKLLRDEGASDEIIEAIRQNSPPLPKPIPTAKPSLSPVSTPTPTPQTTPNVGGKEFKNSIGMEFVRIPRGEFVMGSEKGSDDEKPPHNVTINYEFYMGKYEVTIGEWRKVMGDIPADLKGNDLKFRESEYQPVVGVSWDDAKEFIKKLNAKNDGYTYRLPSEAEWEYAARAGTKTEFAFGDSLSSNQANFDGNYPFGNGAKGKYLEKTVEVGSYQPNAWGLYDMHGNVWEWVEDVYLSSYNFRALPKDGSAYQGEGSSRVVRGGGWVSGGWILRSAYRSNDSPSSRGDNLGFRLVRM